jgi:hypothetical protein
VLIIASMSGKMSGAKSFALFIGWLAAIISVVETCRRVKVPVRDHLGSVLAGLGDFPISRMAELTPAACVTRN